MNMIQFSNVDKSDIFKMYQVNTDRPQAGTGDFMNDCTEQFVRDINRILDEHDHSETTVGYAVIKICTKDGEHFHSTSCGGGNAYIIEQSLQQMINNVRGEENVN
jgi:hypothetical protein